MPTSGLGPSISLSKLYHLDDHAAWEFSDDDLCAAARSVWTSVVYSHFDLSMERVYSRSPSQPGFPVPGHLVYRFTCKCDPSKCTTARKRDRTGQWGTGNLKRLVRSCDKRRGVPDSLAITPVVPFSQLAFRTLLTLWCAVNHRPFNMFSDPLFLEIVSLLRADAIVPCPQTLSSDLAYLYNLASLQISESFAEMDHGIHLAIDGWSSPLTASFLGIVVFWQQDGKIWRSVLEFIHLTEKHTGAYMAEKTLDCLSRFNLTNQIMSVCLDNAANNDTFVRALAHSLPNFQGAKFRMRCIPHILNLAAKAFMAPFTRPPAKKRKTVESPSSPSKRSTGSDLTSPNQGANANTLTPGPSQASPNICAPECPTSKPPTTPGAVPDLLDDADMSRDLHDQDVAQSAVLSVLTEMRSKGFHIPNSDLWEAQDLFPKIFDFAYKIHSKDVLYTRFKAVRHSFKDTLTTRKEVPTEPVSTRWNSDFACAETHRDLREVIDVITNTKVGKDDMTKYKLSDDLWNLLTEVCECLPIFNEPTLFFSQKETPLAHEVVPCMETLKLQLEMMRDAPDGELRPVTRVGAQAALHVLAKYIKLMEESDLPWIAVVMCPWYKLGWFATHGYSSSRIQSIHQATVKLFDKYCTGMANSTTTVPSSVPPTTPSSAALKQRAWMQVPHSVTSGPTQVSQPPSSLLVYLSSPAVPKSEVDQAGGLFKYWSHEKQRGSPLACMALDVLSAPGMRPPSTTETQSLIPSLKASSVDAERAFSSGRMAVNYRQHRMSLDTFRAKMAIGAWFGTPLLEDVDAVLEILQGRGSTNPEPLSLSDLS